MRRKYRLKVGDWVYNRVTIRTGGGKVYPRGLAWRIARRWRGYTLVGVMEGIVSRVDEYEIERIPRDGRS